MKRALNGAAIASLAIGMAGVWLAARRFGLGTLVAIVLGFTAILCCGGAMRAIHRKRPALRGRGLAFLGGVLGVIAVVTGILSLAGAILRPWVNQGRRQDWSGEMRNARAVQRMPDEPATNLAFRLPVIVLQTQGQSIERESDTVIGARFFDVGNGRALGLSKPDFDGLVSINLRGNTTLKLPKPSYTFHTLDAKTNQTKIALLGMPKGEDWVLYAPFEDKTMMRDVLAFQLANRMGHYAPRTRYVELFVDPAPGSLSMRDYAGVYVLVEKIKRGPDRVNIAKLEPQHRSEPEISGGYILRRDHADDGDRGFHTENGGPYYYVAPNGRTITSEQRSWLSRYFRSFEAALYGPNFKDPQTGYAAYLDVDAFIDAHWLIEASKNVDGFRYSAFLVKDRGGKLMPGPPWDWNRSFGNANYYGGWQVNGWYWTNLRPNEISWYLRLREDPAFVRRCKARWIELRKEILDPKRIHEMVDQLAAQLDGAQQRNFQRWPVLGRQVTCNYYVGDSFEDEVRWLKEWISRRVAWIDGQVGARPEDP